MLTLQIKTLLMAGKLEEAFIKGKGCKHIGWSYGDDAGGVLFGGILAALTSYQVDKAQTIIRLLKRYADVGYNDFSTLKVSGEQNKGDTSVSNEILKGLHNFAITDEEKTKLLFWAENIGKRRIDHIVTNKHRKAYERAAEVLVALAECFVINNHKSKGNHIIDEYRNQKYNRFPAFRREVDQILASSKVFGNRGISARR